MPASDALDDAYDLVASARDLLRVDDRHSAGVWPRAAALLGRQAIEQAMAGLWAAVAPGLERESLRCQLICLPEMLNDRELGARTAVVWAALSNACHIRVYEVAPVATELLSWLQTAWDLAEKVAGIRSRMAAAH